MKIIGGFEDVGEMAREAGQAVAKQAKNQTQATVKAAAGQIIGNQTQPADSSDQGTNEQASAAQQKMSDDHAKQFLKDLYGPSKPTDNALNQTNNSNQSTNPQSTVAQAMGLSPDDPNKGKTPEEVAKIASLHKQLHADYYRTLTAPKTPEEHVSDKLEREDQEQQMEELEEEKKKPRALPVTVKQGTGENVVGVSG
jgi:hypothetical protein